MIFISYVYQHVCERTDRVVSINNGFDTKSRIGFVGKQPQLTLWR